jgi:hypothetical protein
MEKSSHTDYEIVFHSVMYKIVIYNHRNIFVYKYYQINNVYDIMITGR